MVKCDKTVDLGAFAVITSLSIRTLMRTPLKTLLTFLVLSATSFTFFFGIAEYVVTAREFRRAAGFYQGVGAVEAAPMLAEKPTSPALYGRWVSNPTIGSTDALFFADERIERNPQSYSEDVAVQYQYEGIS